ncbi:TetR/AcrR family transcriptional regulator [Planotetraspora sp. A-T 1434]|uniref:TetR/AcrR family transcriptional regulator n=1 Tax=Planotetraspora sp. A-T 1434 TaxID=2979219 RepID=UPI0021BE3DD7|nr:TetR/AcrR family transcriptional regulator [Planotetraspora sp. A-T 1434]MCT9930035.1 TetR/AcrR family transcriptional regulator [Planotetraspora sp. A-T 1434]
MTTQQTEGVARPAGRPRSEKAEKAIIDAALDLLGEGIGVPELSIEAIAARAGVGKTTIYRRWSNKEDLVVDALASLKPPIPPLHGASVRDDLVTYLRVVGEESRHMRTRCIMNIAMSAWERHPRLAERFQAIAIEPRKAALRAVLQRGTENGELRSDLDIEMAMAILSGAMLWRTKWSGENAQLPGDLPEQIVDEALRGFRPR